jgi:hypothetical protein
MASDQNQLNYWFGAAAPEMRVTMAGGGPGRIPAEQMLENIKPLSEKQFYNNYSQHIDIRGRQGGTAEDNLKSVLEGGFKQGGNVNTLPPSRGGEPMNIIEKKFAPKAGDIVYLVPNSATQEMGNGRVINQGWIPQSHEVIRVTKDNPSMYEEYLKAIGK